jgi:hypothetical protein
MGDGREFLGKRGAPVGMASGRAEPCRGCRLSGVASDRRKKAA